MKLLLGLSIMVVSLPAFATTSFTCDEGDLQLAFTAQDSSVVSYQATWGRSGGQLSPEKVLPNGVNEYWFLVDDSDDTVTWFVIDLKKEKIESTSVWTTGHDTDNQTPSPSEMEISCLKRRD